MNKDTYYFPLDYYTEIGRGREALGSLIKNRDKIEKIEISSRQQINFNHESVFLSTTSDYSKLRKSHLTILLSREGFIECFADLKRFLGRGFLSYCINFPNDKILSSILESFCTGKSVPEKKVYVGISPLSRISSKKREVVGSNFYFLGGDDNLLVDKLYFLDGEDLFCCEKSKIGLI